MITRGCLLAVVTITCVKIFTIEANGSGQATNNTVEDLSYSAMQVIPGISPVSQSDNNLFKTCMMAIQGSQNPAEVGATLNSSQSVPTVTANRALLVRTSSNIIGHNISQSLHQPPTLSIQGSTSASNSVNNLPTVTIQTTPLAINTLSVQRSTSASNSVNNIPNATIQTTPSTRNTLSIQGSTSVSNSINNLPNVTIHTTPSAINTLSIQGSTSASNIAHNILNATTPEAPSASIIHQSNQNPLHSMIRSGLHVISEGAKAGATVSSIPSNVVMSGIEEIKKVADARLSPSNAPESLDVKTKIVSNVMNTVSSQLSQVNLGGALVEEALKNRVKDMVSKVAEVAKVPGASQLVQATTNIGNRMSGLLGVPVVTNTLLNQFNSAIRRNDERLMQALRGVIGIIGPRRNNV